MLMALAPTIVLADDYVVLRFVVGETTYTINDVPSQLDAAPFNHAGRVMVPLRQIGEAIGATVIAFEDNTAIIDDLRLPIGVELAGGMGMPVIVDGRTFVPLGYIAAAIGANPRWDGTANAAYIYIGAELEAIPMSLLDDYSGFLPFPMRLQAELGRLLSSLTFSQQLYFETGSALIQLGNDWEIVYQPGTPMPFMERAYNITITPPDGEKSAAIVSIGKLTDGQPLSNLELHTLYEILLGAVLPYAVEDEPVIMNMPIINGAGLFSIITDSRLVGTEIPPDRYLHLGIFLGNLDNGAFIHATVLTDDTWGRGFLSMVLALMTIDVEFE